MGKLSEQKIESIPSDEVVLKEGMMYLMRLFATGNTKYTRYPYKYVLTEKGVWTKSKGFLFIKGKEGFMPYSSIASYRESKFGKNVGYVFTPKSGKKPANRLFFDDAEGVLAIINKYITSEE